MRVLALDIGCKRVGVAISDECELISQPLCVLPANDVIQNAKTFRRIVQDWEPDMLLCGLPLSLDGNNSEQTLKVRKNAEVIAKNVGLPLEFIDERLSSKEARSILREQGLSEKEMRGRIDAVAASIFLQTWLDERR